MSLFGWLSDLILGLFGLNNKRGRILFLGLDFAGKTTLLHLLKTGKFTASAPTHYGSAEVISNDLLTANLYDFEEKSLNCLV